MYDDGVATKTDVSGPFILKLAPDGGPLWAKLGEMVSPAAPANDGRFEGIALGANGALRVVGKTTDGTKDWALLEAY
jgi:hypothetical protein